MKVNHVAWNLLGLGVPLVLALATIPSLVSALGMERFGLLTLAWALISYAGVFDLGIGRATTQYIARLRGIGRGGEARQILLSALKLTVITGGVGALVLCLAALMGAHRLLNYTQSLDAEVKASFILLALILPLQALSATFRGVNEAFENFRDVSIIRIFLGGMNFLGPLATTFVTTKLHWLVLSLLASRIVALLAFRLVAEKVLPAIEPQRHGDASTASVGDVRRELLKFGGWATVSSVISPLLLQMDRFVIAGVISAYAVAIYTLPYELVVQSLVIVGAVTSVAFPTLTRLLHEDPDGWLKTFNLWTVGVTGAMTVVAATIALILPVFLPWWLHNSFDARSVSVGQILCLGVVANSIGSMYYALIQAHGRSDVTAKLHILELPIYLVALVILLEHFGVVGAACAWSGRMALDASLLYYRSRSLHV